MQMPSPLNVDVYDEPLENPRVEEDDSNSILNFFDPIIEVVT